MGDTLIVSIYVDGLHLTRKNHDIILRLRTWLDGTFEMKELGILHFFLSLQILPLLDGLFISQYNYAETYAETF